MKPTLYILLNLLKCAVPEEYRAIWESDPWGEILSGVDDVHGTGDEVEAGAGPGGPLPVHDDAHPHTNSWVSVSTLCSVKMLIVDG